MAGMEPVKSPRPEAQTRPDKHHHQENIIRLKDGTRIVIRQKDYLFIGPKGQRSNGMVVNCLPLFEVHSPEQRDEMRAESKKAKRRSKKRASTTVTESSAAAAKGPVQATRSHSIAMKKLANRFVIQKAHSSENLLSTKNTKIYRTATKRSCEAEDVMEPAGREGVDVKRDQWSYSSNPMLADHDTSIEDSVSFTSDHTHPVVHVQTPQDLALLDLMDKEKEEGEGEKVGEREEERAREKVGCEENSKEAVSAGVQGVANGRLTSSDGGSEGEEREEVKVNYIQNPEQIATLKRSSGSVSFIGIDRGRSQSPLADVREEVGGEEGRMVRVGEEKGGGEEERGRGKAEVEGGGVGEQKEGERGGEEREGEKEHRGEEKNEIRRGNGMVKGGRRGGGGEGETERGEEPTIQEEAHVEEDKDAAKDLPQTETSLQPPPSRSTPTSAAAPLSSSSHTPATPQPSLQSAPHHPPQATEPLQSRRSRVTPLPPPPFTLEPQFIEKSGWLSKLSHKKGKLNGSLRLFIVRAASWVWVLWGV